MMVHFQGWLGGVSLLTKMVSAETLEAVKNHPTALSEGWMLVLTLAGAPSMGLLPADMTML